MARPRTSVSFGTELKHHQEPQEQTPASQDDLKRCPGWVLTKIEVAEAKILKMEEQKKLAIEERSGNKRKKDLEKKQILDDFKKQLQAKEKELQKKESDLRELEGLILAFQEESASTSTSTSTSASASPSPSASAPASAPSSISSVSFSSSSPPSSSVKSLSVPSLQTKVSSENFDRSQSEEEKGTEDTPHKEEEEASVNEFYFPFSSIENKSLFQNSRMTILKALLNDDDYPFVDIVGGLINTTDQDKFAQCVIQYYNSQERALDVLESEIIREVVMTDHSSTLFRGNSVASKMMRVYSRMIGMDYLKKTLNWIIKDVKRFPIPIELDPEKLPSKTELESNVMALISISNKFLNHILQSLESAPLQFRRICNTLRVQVGKYFPDNEHLSIGTFIFLRFLCPAIASPEGFGLGGTGGISPTARRTLILVSKVLQNLANGRYFKEDYMVPMNPFIDMNTKRLTRFFDEMARVPPNMVEMKAPQTESETKTAITQIEQFIKNYQAKILKILPSYENNVFKMKLELPLGDLFNEVLMGVSVSQTHSNLGDDECTVMFSKLLSDHRVIAALSQLLRDSPEVSQQHMQSISYSICVLLQEDASAFPMLINYFKLVGPSIKDLSKMSTLLGCRLLVDFFRMNASNLINTLFGSAVHMIAKYNKPVEIEKERAEKHALPVNQGNIKEITSAALNEILNNLKKCPLPVHKFFRGVYQAFPKAQKEKAVVVVFLSLILPVIVSPNGYGISVNLSEQQLRSLQLVHLVLEVALYEGKFPFKGDLSVINHYVKKELPGMIHDFFQGWLKQPTPHMQQIETNNVIVGNKPSELIYTKFEWIDRQRALSQLTAFLLDPLHRKAVLTNLGNQSSTQAIAMKLSEAFSILMSNENEN